MPSSAQPAAPASRWVLSCRGRRLDCGPGQTHVMGILNVTPDSFSDGGRYTDIQAALRRARSMAQQGAAIIDVGGESTRPRGATYGTGAQAVNMEDELARVIPVIEAIARELPDVLISIDTYKGAVARAALLAGAHIVNDVTGLRHGVGTAHAAAEYGAPLVLMHAVGKPGEMVHVQASGDIVAEVADSLERSVRTADEAGVRDIIVDAGFGFGKTSGDNLRLVAETDRVRQRLKRPVLVGASRKSTVGQVLASGGDAIPADQRAWGSVGLAVLAALRGASIVRVHDVAETVQALRVALAAEAERQPLAPEADEHTPEATAPKSPASPEAHSGVWA